jgi:thiamine biosynthesis lipoprotein
MPTATDVRPAAAQWRAIGCDVRVVVTDPDALDAATRIVAEQVDALDLAASRFRPDSDLERVNAGSGRPVAVGPLLLDALDVALDAARRTGGDVDPTLGGALVDLGYDRTFRQVAGTGPAVKVSVRRTAAWSQVVVDRDAGTVTVPDGVRLDLGATAKAFGADRAAAAVHAALGVGVLVSLGGDIAVAGDPPVMPEPDGRLVAGWPVRVQDRPGPVDETPDGPSSVVLLAAGGVATSSVTARRWARGGQEMHHVLDPRTSMPAVTPWRTVTVAAASCVEANIATTAAVVRGENAVEWLTSLGVPARLVSLDGRVHVLGGWPSE